MIGMWEGRVSEGRSVRPYTAAPVPSEAVAALLEAADRAPVGRHTAKGYGIAVIRRRALIDALSRESEIAPGDSPIAGIPLLLVVYRTPLVSGDLVSLDTGYVVSAIQKRAGELGLYAYVSYQLVKKLPPSSPFLAALHLPEGSVPVLAAAVGGEHPSGQSG